MLQRSGLGDPKKLKEVGVECKVDLPGVGLILQDHYLTFSAYRAKPDVESFDDFLRGKPEVQKKVFDQWNINGTGPLGTNGIEAGVKIRPTEEELKSDYMKEFVPGWDSYFKNKPEKPVMHYSVIFGYINSFHSLLRALLILKNSFFGDHVLMPEGKFFSMFHFLNSKICHPFAYVGRGGGVLPRDHSGGQTSGQNGLFKDHCQL